MFTLQSDGRNLIVDERCKGRRDVDKAVVPLGNLVVLEELHYVRVQGSPVDNDHDHVADAHELE